MGFLLMEADCCALEVGFAVFFLSCRSANKWDHFIWTVFLCDLFICGPPVVLSELVR